MRTARKQSPADLYHVVARGTGRQLIFEDDNDRRCFLALLEEALDATSAELYAWCLMNNHVHLLLHAPLDKLAALMKVLCGQYAQYFNGKAGRVGHLFQERFKSEPIDNNAYLMTVIRYIHDNPAKAALSAMDEYPWSSYGEYINHPRLCKTSFPLEVFGGIEGFLAFHASEAPDERCLEFNPVRTSSHAMPDEVAIQFAEEILGGIPLNSLKALPRKERDYYLSKFKGAGLSIRQIERLTGIGRGVVAKAGKVDSRPVTCQLLQGDDDEQKG